IKQGSGFSVRHPLNRFLDQIKTRPPLYYAGREAFAAPAVGYAGVHIEQQQKLVQSALVGDFEDKPKDGS
ncbi:MAG TPA: hypothetical protein DDZ38_04370, partial [Gammaproteobacteria bacterium]|nr:hypothetical protein [Gammaproteobacteria bacterium]